MAFIDEIAAYIIKYAPQYGIKVYSPIIAQSILESASGTSELAKNAHNYFGLKYRANRCPSASGTYIKVGSEQSANGKYTSSTMTWFKFKNMESGVKGYFEFISIHNYSNLKGITDPKKYLETIKSDGYCTSLNYVNNVMNVIKKYNLTKYDKQSNKNESLGGDKMVINVHGGHNPKGKVACGAVGLLNESEQDRIIKDKVIALLRSKGHTVYDCTVDNGISQNDVLRKIVAKCNAHKANLDVSIHFNAGAKDQRGNGKTTGSEVWIYKNTSSAKPAAQRIVNNLASIGFANRGVKTSTGLYFLRKAASPALLIEVCFVDDRDDYNVYMANVDKVAKAIAEGILGTTINSTSSTTTTTPATKPSTSTTTSSKYFYNGLDYSLVFNPTYYANTYADLKKAFGTNAKELWNHFKQNGMKEGRKASANFDVKVYKNTYADLRAAFGENLPLYYKHYIEHGKKEGRKAV